MVGGKIGVGIVGVTPGRSWATLSHIPALQALPQYEVVGVANSNEASARAAASAYGIARAFADVSALAADPDVDLVAITVKVPYHKVLIDAALDAGKMVYCEWPLGNGLAEAAEVADRARNLGVRTAVGLQARSSPVIRYIRDLIRNGYVGQVLSTTLVGSAVSQGAFAPAEQAYLYQRKYGATALTIPFGHTIDALCWCLGEFSEVWATLASRRQTFTVIETQEIHPVDVDDQIVVGGTLRNGTVVSAHYRGGVSRGTNLLWEINGTEGDLRITADYGHAQMFDLTLAGGRGDDTTLSTMQVPPGYRTIPDGISGFATNVAQAYVRFADGPSADDQIPNFDAAVQRHKLLDAIERSAASGQKVML